MQHVMLSWLLVTLWIPRAAVEPAHLDRLVEMFLDLFVAAFGFDYMPPKNHWLLHFGDHLQRHGFPGHTLPRVALCISPRPGGITTASDNNVVRGRTRTCDARWRRRRRVHGTVPDRGCAARVDH